MRIVVIGSGVAGLTAARALAGEGHEVTVLDKGRRPGGRLATRELAGSARADHGAQFFTARSERFRETVAGWLARSAVHEWCRGFSSQDGHPRYAAGGGMAQLAALLAADLDVRQSVRVDAATSQPGGTWRVGWPAAHGHGAGSIIADALVVSAPAPQAAALLDGQASVPELAYAPALALMLALDRTPAIAWPGAVQLAHDATFTWVADNLAKGVSRVPSLTLHTRPDVAERLWPQDDAALLARLSASAAPWLGGARIVGAAVHRWRYAMPLRQYPERCALAADGRVVLAGDAFGEPRVEGAFLSGLAAAASLSPLAR